METLSSLHLSSRPLLFFPKNRAVLFAWLMSCDSLLFLVLLRHLRFDKKVLFYQNRTFLLVLTMSPLRCLASIWPPSIWNSAKASSTSCWLNLSPQVIRECLNLFSSKVWGLRATYHTLLKSVDFNVAALFNTVFKIMQTSYFSGRYFPTAYTGCKKKPMLLKKNAISREKMRSWCLTEVK